MTHLICLNISGISKEQFDRLYAFLPPERKQKADSLRDFDDRLRSVAAGALLRYAVRECLGIDNFSLEIGAFGKPTVLESSDFHFNLSHSGHWVVLAWGDSPVGVDVQQRIAHEKAKKIAVRHFTSQEQSFSAQGDNQFLKIWTAKESYLKYLGTGLSIPLKSFCVLPNGTQLQVHFHNHPLDTSHLVTLCTAEDTYTIRCITFCELIGGLNETL